MFVYRDWKTLYCRTNHPPHHPPHFRTRHTPSYTYYPTTFSSLTPVDIPEYSPVIPPVQFTTNNLADPPIHDHDDNAHADYNTTDRKANALFGDFIFINTVHLPNATDIPSHPDNVSKKSASSASSSTTHYQYNDNNHLHLDHLSNHSNYHSNHTSKYHSDPHSHLHPTDHPSSSAYSYHINIHTDHDSCPYDDNVDSNNAGFE